MLVAPVVAKQGLKPRPVVMIPAFARTTAEVVSS
jgi:hypothetical protein